MPDPDRWPAAAPITTGRLTLEPLRVEHADELAPVLDDQALHTWIGGRPATAAQLRERFARQVVGRSPDGRQGWLNWVVRVRDGAAAAGTVQATLEAAGAGTTASLAWVIATPFQGRGYATEAAAAVLAWLPAHGADRFVAWIHPENAASAAVARRLGLAPTSEVEDGETGWRSPAPG